MPPASINCSSGSHIVWWQLAGSLLVVRHFRSTLLKISQTPDMTGQWKAAWGCVSACPHARKEGSVETRAGGERSQGLVATSMAVTKGTQRNGPSFQSWLLKTLVVTKGSARLAQSTHIPRAGKNKNICTQGNRLSLKHINAPCLQAFSSLLFG